MTAKTLHRLFESTTDEAESYDGGMDVGRTHFQVRSEKDDIDVDFSVRLGSGQMAAASFYKQLSPDEARELALALERGASAAEASRAVEIERTRG